MKSGFENRLSIIKNEFIYKVLIMPIMFIDMTLKHNILFS